MTFRSNQSYQTPFPAAESQVNTKLKATGNPSDQWKSDMLRLKPHGAFLCLSENSRNWDRMSKSVTILVILAKIFARRRMTILQSNRTPSPATESQISLRKMMHQYSDTKMLQSCWSLARKGQGGQGVTRTDSKKPSRENIRYFQSGRRRNF